MEEVERITKELAQGYNEQSEYYSGSEKSPAVAVLLSFLLPGLGQYYNDDIVKGVVMDAFWVGGWAVYFAAGYEDVYDVYSYWDP
jgi:TM2 domain-containing membrane protein YozV